MGVSNGDEDGGGVDGDGSGGNSPSRQGAGTETSVPRNLSSMAAELGVVFCEILRGVRVFSAGAIYGPKGSVRGCTRQPHHPSARPRVFLAEPTCRACTGRIRCPFWTNKMSISFDLKFSTTLWFTTFPFDVVFGPKRIHLRK